MNWSLFLLLLVVVAANLSLDCNASLPSTRKPSSFSCFSCFNPKTDDSDDDHHHHHHHQHQSNDVVVESDRPARNTGREETREADMPPPTRKHTSSR